MAQRRAPEPAHQALESKTEAPAPGAVPTDVVVDAEPESVPKQDRRGAASDGEGDAPEAIELLAVEEDAPEAIEVLDVEEDLDIEEVLASIEELSGAARATSEASTTESDAHPHSGDPLETTGRPELRPAPAAMGDSNRDVDSGDAAEDIDEELAPLSKPAERDRLIAQALAHAEAQDARYRQPIPGADRVGRWKGLLATIVLVIAGYVAAAPPSWVSAEGAPPIAASDQLRGVRVVLLLQAEEIETFRALNRRLPESLEELPQQLSGVRLVRSGPRAYQLFAFTPRGERIVYDPISPDPEFESVQVELTSVLEAND